MLGAQRNLEACEGNMFRLGQEHNFGPELCESVTHRDGVHILSHPDVPRVMRMCNAWCGLCWCRLMLNT